MFFAIPGCPMQTRQAENLATFWQGFRLSVAGFMDIPPKRYGVSALVVHNLIFAKN